MKRYGKERCAALDRNGTRCRRPAVRMERYHGDREIYDSYGCYPTWVRVVLCEQHSVVKKP